MSQNYIPSPSFSIAFNSSVSVGFLGTIWCFQHLSILPAILLTVFFGLISYMISLMVINTLQRAQTYCRMQHDKLEPPSLSFSDLLIGLFHKHTWLDDSIKMPLVLKEKLDRNMCKYNCAITSEMSIELTDIHRMFLGRIGLNVYCGALVVGLMSLYVGYSMFFCMSLWKYTGMGEINTEEIEWKYVGIVGVYTGVVGYLTYIGVKQQLKLQILATLFRICIICIMILTAIYAILTSEPLNTELKYNLPAEPSSTSFGIYGSTLIFLTSFQMMIPTMLSNSNTEHSYINQSLTTTVLKAHISLVLLTCLLGVIVTISLHNYAIPYLSSLAWSNYTAGFTYQNRPAITYLIGYLVLFFPLINVISIQIITTAPLVSSTLIYNLQRYLTYEYDIKYSSKVFKLLCGGIHLCVFMVTIWYQKFIMVTVLSGIAAYYLIFISTSIVFLVSIQKIPFPSVEKYWSYVGIMGVMIGCGMSYFTILSIYS